MAYLGINPPPANWLAPASYPPYISANEAKVAVDQIEARRVLPGQEIHSCFACWARVCSKLGSTVSAEAELIL